jgi:hypothetical protein
MEEAESRQNQAVEVSEDGIVNSRLKGLGVMLAVIGLAFIAGGGYALYRTNQGAQSLQAFSAAQNVKLSYNEAGQLVDRGETEGAAKIMSLLTNDWGYAVSTSELNPNDPLVNTASEYMYQMATIAYHTLHGTQTIVLAEDVTAADGTVTKAGTYEFAVDGRYWSGFDRTNPIEAAAREKAWTGTAHALIANLGVGSVTASTLQLGVGLAALFAALGGTFFLTGLGLVWATRAQTEKIKVPALRPVTA